MNQIIQAIISEHIKRGHGYKKSLKYCSYKCYQARPPKVIEVETTFKDTIENLIEESEQFYDYETDRARSLGITRDTYRRWKVKYI